MQLMHHYNEGQKLSARAQARWDAYTADPAVAAQLRALAPRSIALYEFAKQRYNSQWTKPMGTC